MPSKKGHNYENQLAKEIYRNTGPLIYPVRCGYSGSNAYPLPDIVVFDNGATLLHGLEVKNISSETAQITESDDLYQLDVFNEGPNQRSWLVIKFSRRAPVTIPILDVQDKSFEYTAERVVYIMEQMGLDGFNPRVSTSKTGVSRLYLDKPSTDDWPAAQTAGEDYREILESMGIYDDG